MTSHSSFLSVNFPFPCFLVTSHLFSFIFVFVLRPTCDFGMGPKDKGFLCVGVDCFSSPFLGDVERAVVVERRGYIYCKGGWAGTESHLFIHHPILHWEELMVLFGSEFGSPG